MLCCVLLINISGNILSSTIYTKYLIMNSNSVLKGRGAQRNVHNRFLELSHETRDDFLEYCQKEGEESDKNKTLYLDVFPKTIINKVTSPDVGMMYSMNPYQ